MPKRLFRAFHHCFSLSAINHAVLKLAEDYFRKLGRKGERVAKEVLDYLHHVIPTVGKAGAKNAVIKSRHSRGVVWLKKKFVGDKAKHSVPTAGDVGDEKRKGHTMSLSKLSPIDGNDFRSYVYF